jgi:hypothetical protein
MLYTLTVIDARGCMATDAVEITVFAPPVIAAAPNIIACRGAAAQLRPQVMGGLPPYAYAWTPTAGLNDPNILQPMAQPAATTSYILTVTDARGCIAYDTVLFTVQAPPGVTLDESLQICTGGSVMLDPVVSVAPEHGTVTYRWSPSTGLSGAFIRNPIASPVTTTTYVLTITDVRGCSIVDSVRVNVVPQLDPEITSTTGFTACQGQTVRLDAGGGYSRYKWSTGDTTRMITLTSDRRVSVEVFAGTGCSGKSDTVHVQFLARPTAVVQGVPSACQDSVAQYAVTEIPNATYRWSVNGGEFLSIPTVAQVQVRWTTASASSVMCTVTAASGCSDTSEVYTVTVLPTPQRPDVSRTDNLLTSTVAAAYQWIRNGSDIEGATQRQYAVTQNGQYAVRVWDAASCTNRSDELTVIVSDVAESENSAITITPQPTSEEATIRWTEGIEITSVEVYSMTGDRMLAIDGVLGRTQQTFDVSELPTGSYLVVLTSPHRVWTSSIRILR